MARMRSWVRLVAVLLFIGGGYFGFASAQAPDTKQPAPPFQLPAALNKVAPENIEDLRAIEQHVQKVLEKVMPAVIGVRVGGAQGSGVIVKEDGTIITAGHVSGTPNRPVTIILPTGKTYKGKSLGKNGGIDSGMMKIIEAGKYPFLEMGKSSDLKPGQWVLAIGHPGGFRANRTPVVRVGRILVANQFVIRTDCTLVGGDSGGPLFDMQGRVIGIHSRIGGAQITQNMHVPIDTYHRTWDRLARGESFGGQLGQPAVVRSAGGKVIFERQDKVVAEDPLDKVKMDCRYKLYTVRLQAAATYTIDLISGDKTGKKFDTFLRLESPDGKTLAEDDDGGGFPHARIVHKATKDGDYRIIATSFEPNQTGSFTLKILQADITDPFVRGKVEVLPVLKVPSPAVAPLVEKFKKVKLPIHLNAILIDDQGNPLPDKELTVYWEKGKETFKSNGEGVVRWALVPDKSKKLALELPQGIRALLALTDGEGIPVDLAFLKGHSIEKVKSAGGQIIRTIDAALTKKDPFDLERKQCYRQVLEVKLQAGKTYTLDLVSEDFDAYLRLENNQKGKLVEDNDGAGNMNARIVYTPTMAGTYRIVVTTSDPGQLGTFQLILRETAAPPTEAKQEEKKSEKK